MTTVTISQRRLAFSPGISFFNVIEQSNIHVQVYLVSFIVFVQMCIISLILYVDLIKVTILI